MVIRGADTERLAALELEVNGVGGRLDQLLGREPSFVSGLRQSWLGTDAEGFLGQWQGVDRPALQSVSDRLTEIHEVLRRNRLAQEETSATSEGSSGGTSPFPLQGGGGVVIQGTGAISGDTSLRVDEPEVQTIDREPPMSDRLDSPESRIEVLDRAEKYLGVSDAARQRLPQSFGRADEWLAELDGSSSPEEVAAFERYLATVKVAHMNQITVRNSATFAFEQLLEAGKSGAAAIGGGVTFSDADRFMLPDSLQGDAGAEFALEVLNSTYGLSTDLIGGGAIDLVTNAGDIPGLAGEVAVKQYLSDADQLLAGMEDRFRASDGIGHTDPFDLAMTDYWAYASNLDLVRVEGQRADAFVYFTGDGSVIDTALRESLGAVGDVVTGGLMSKSLDGLAIVGNTAAAGYQIEAAKEALILAGSGTDRLLRQTDMVIVD